MASNAFSGIGTMFFMYSNVHQNWIDIAEINSISGPSMSRETIDVTSLSSTGGYREFIASIKTGGSVNLSMNFTRLTYDAFKGAFDSNNLRLYKILLPDTEATTFTFYGLVMELPIEISIDDKVTADVTIQISGEPQLSKGRGDDTYANTSDSDSYPGLGESGFLGFESDDV